MEYPVATIGTVVTIAAAVVLDRIGVALINRRASSSQQRYGWRGNLGICIGILATIVVLLFWVRLFPNKGTFFGLIGAGFAVALREPLLSLAGRLSIWAGKMYRVGDRIEFQSMAGDVIEIGFFYTRMLEIGNWIHGDQATGRIVQFPNASVYQHAVYNYTQNFKFIWDEIQLPITYASNVEQATQILLEVGEEYTASFAEDAKIDIERMRRSALLPDLNFKPTVFTKVTSNYIQLDMRYLVDPRRRRATSSYLYTRLFDRIKDISHITIGSDTMNLTLYDGDKQDAATGSNNYSGAGRNGQRAAGLPPQQKAG